MKPLFTEIEEEGSGGKAGISSILFSLLVLACTLFICAQLWKRRWLYYWGWRANGPFSWPVLGNGIAFLGGTQDFLETVMGLVEKYEPPMKIWLGGRLMFGVSQPKDLEKVLNGALAKDHLYSFTEPIAGTGLFNAPVEKWKRHRRVILPTFNHTILSTFVEIFADHANTLVEKLEQKSGKGTFDVFPIFGRCTLDIICETALGKKVYAQVEDSDFGKWVGRMMEIMYTRMFQVWFHSDFIWKFSSLSTESVELAMNIRRLINDLVVEKKQTYRKLKNSDLDQEEYVTGYPKRRKAFLDYIVELSEKGEHWTNEEIIDEAATITIAGNDSTANMDSFVLMMLGMHPEVQVKVHEELDDVFGTSERNVTVDDLPKLRYLELVIKETMRLFPVGPIIVRSIDNDLKLDNFVFPKGSSAALVILHTHRNPEIWPDPLKFVPERFLPEESAKRHPYAYIPFSGGPRNCIGPKYAMMSMKAVLSTVLRHFKIGTKFKKVEDIALKADIMIRCVGGYNISLKCRKKH